MRKKHHFPSPLAAALLLAGSLAVHALDNATAGEAGRVVEGHLPGSPNEAAEALFRQHSSWLGSDGASSTPLGAGRIFWSFEDTFIAITGPWSDPQMVYSPPERHLARPFIYSALAHPELSASGKALLVVSYATNAFEFSELLSEYGSEHLYWPRMINVDLEMLLP